MPWRVLLIKNYIIPQKYMIIFRPSQYASFFDSIKICVIKRCSCSTFFSSFDKFSLGVQKRYVVSKGISRKQLNTFVQPNRKKLNLLNEPEANFSMNTKKIVTKLNQCRNFDTKKKLYKIIYVRCGQIIIIQQEGASFCFLELTKKNYQSFLS